MSQKVKCPVCSVDYDIRGFPTHLATKHPSEFAKNNGIMATANNTGNVSLEDSGKLKADIVTLQDSVKTKDIELAELRDSVRQKDAEFATLHDEIATLNDKNKYLESNEYLKTYLLKLTQEAYDQLGAALFPERATVEDSKSVPETVKATTPEVVAPTVTTITTDSHETSRLQDHVRAPEEYIFIGDKKEPGWVFYSNMGFSLKES
jgi:predicted nuclease with TOPRIM domain